MIRYTIPKDTQKEITRYANTKDRKKEMIRYSIAKRYIKVNDKIYNYKRK